MINQPTVKLAIVAVSRDCFPLELSRIRAKALAEACEAAGQPVYLCETIIQNENDAMIAVREAKHHMANAAVLYLGNFGPEGPEAIFAKHFNMPVMACAAAEESKNTLMSGRGDAYCGLLNASYNFALRGVRVHIPECPVGLPDELAMLIKHFALVAKVVIGVKDLKVFGFGPRPHDFFACNAPIAPLYDLGIEVTENSELDLLVLFDAIKPDDPEIAEIAADMTNELGIGNIPADLLPKMARYELALMRYWENNRGSRRYAVFANKCWPAFEATFGFVPCYVNSRLASRGIPVACEVDLYGAVSEFMCMLASDQPATLLDINNTVPADLLAGQFHEVALRDLFMGFHCGNTPSCQMKNCALKYQVIMASLMPQDITRGTLEGQLRPGPATFYRLQGDINNVLRSYIAPGNILDVDPGTFGGIGVFAIPDFARFYRHVLIGKQFPHHGAVAFNDSAEVLYDATKLLGVEDISFPLPSGTLYPYENPFTAKVVTDSVE